MNVVGGRRMGDQEDVGKLYYSELLNVLLWVL